MVAETEIKFSGLSAMCLVSCCLLVDVRYT
ncbi:hypothetical protein BRC2024_OFSGVTRC_CDS_0108 [Acinetobacter phage vB_AbaM_Rocket]